MSGSLVSGNNRDPLADRKDDLYETPPEAVFALVAAEKLPDTIWESACGPGSIATVLEGLGHVVYSSDLVDYGYSGSVSGVDFLLERRPPLGYEAAIVTNPPYKLAAAFVERACELVPYVAMLLRFEFAAGARRGLLERHPISRVYVFRNRLPRMHRAGWTGPRSTSRLSFAWFVWDRTHRGPTELHRISWRPLPATSPAEVRRGGDSGPLFTLR